MTPKRDLHEGMEEPSQRIFEEVLVEIVTITPEIASQWLDVNYKNRPLRKRGANAYGRDVESNNWVLTGDTIKFDWFGRLVDGQHRLTAVATSGKPITSLVVWGVDPRARKFTDTGMARQYRDVLRMEDVPNWDIIAPFIRRVVLWDPPTNERLNFSRDKITPAEHEDALVLHPEVHHCAAFAAEVPLNGIRLSRSLVAFVYWVLLYANADEAREFMTKVGSGANIGDRDPIMRLRIWVSEYGRRDRRFDAEFLWRSVVAWNAWMEGRSLMKIQLPRGGMKADNFPRLRTKRKSAKED